MIAAGLEQHEHAGIGWCRFVQEPDQRAVDTHARVEVRDHVLPLRGPSSQVVQGARAGEPCVARSRRRNEHQRGEKNHDRPRGTRRQQPVAAFHQDVRTGDRERRDDGDEVPEIRRTRGKDQNHRVAEGRQDQVREDPTPPQERPEDEEHKQGTGVVEGALPLHRQPSGRQKEIDQIERLPYFAEGAPDRRAHGVGNRHRSVQRCQPRLQQAIRQERVHGRPQKREFQQQPRSGHDSTDEGEPTEQTQGSPPPDGALHHGPYAERRQHERVRHRLVLHGEREAEEHDREVETVPPALGVRQRADERVVG